MPDSSMSAATASRLKVSGSSMAIAASGPMPGSTPIIVPTKTPRKQYARFFSVSAMLKPRYRLGKRSASASISTPRKEPIRQFEAVDEKRNRSSNQEHDKNHELQRARVASGE